MEQPWIWSVEPAYSPQRTKM
jgi:selenocysteine lyase/cysteine desulfurase